MKGGNKLMEKKILTIVLSIVFLIVLMTISVSATTTTASSSKQNTYNATCMQNAVIKRESAIMSAYQNFISQLVGEFQIRSASLISAYGLIDSKERKEAVKEAWKVYTISYRASTKEMTNTRDAIWRAFNSDKALCNNKENIESSRNEIKL
jgi:hypothetical protein